MQRILIFLCICLLVKTQVSPCPDLFEYVTDGKNNYYGRIHVPSLPFNQEVNLEVNFFINYNDYLSYEYYSENLYCCERNGPMEYIVRFATKLQLGRIKSIIYNSMVICEGNLEYDSSPLHLRFKFSPASPLPLSSSPSSSSFSSSPIIPKSPSNEIKLIPRMSDDNESENDSCGIIDNEFRMEVIEDQTLSRGSWPWLSAIYSSDDSSTLNFLCGGNLVSDRVVVTVAHCLKSMEKIYQAHEIVVHLGRFNIKKWIPEEGSELKESQIVFSHPDFMKENSASFDADIAVIVLKTPVKFNKFIQPICLPTDPSLNIQKFVGNMGTVVGWGRDNSGQTLTPEPQTIHVPIVSQGMCWDSDETFRQITSNRTFCAGNRDGTGPCNGDSGSGLAIQMNNKWTLRGLVSVATLNPTNEVCNLNNYVVYTDIEKFITWIQFFTTF